MIKPSPTIVFLNILKNSIEPMRRTEISHRLFPWEERYNSIILMMPVLNEALTRGFVTETIVPLENLEWNMFVYSITPKGD
jgi:hypothetical protein